MDVELQILKHLKRDAQPTVAIIARYCSAYNLYLVLIQLTSVMLVFSHLPPHLLTCP